MTVMIKVIGKGYGGFFIATIIVGRVRGTSELTFGRHRQLGYFATRGGGVGQVTIVYGNSQGGTMINEVID